MSNLNSSGSNERFPLASGGSRVFFTDQGGNHVECEVHGDDQSAASVTVKLQTSEDNVTFTDVATVTVVPSGSDFLNGLVGKYARLISTSGNDQVLLAARFRNRCQVVPKL